MRRCTVMEAACEQKIPEEDLRENLFQTAVAKAADKGEGAPVRERFDAQKALDREVKEQAAHDGLIESGEDDDKWADAASFAEISRIDGEIEVLKKRCHRVENILQETIARAYSNNVRLGPAERKATPKSFHEAIKKYAPQINTNPEIVSWRTGSRHLDMELKNMHQIKERIAGLRKWIETKKTSI